MNTHSDEEECVYLHEVSAYEEDFVKKMIDPPLRFLAKVYKTEDSKGQRSRRPRVRIVALGKHRLFTIRSSLGVSVVTRAAHIHDLYRIAILEDETILRIEFKQGQEPALTITIPWETPMTASLVRMLLSAWYETGGNILASSASGELIPELELGKTFDEATIAHLVTKTSKESSDIALYTRLRSYVWRGVKANSIATLTTARESTVLDLGRAVDEKNRLTKLDIYAIAGVMSHSLDYTTLTLEKKRLEENACSELVLPAVAASKSLQCVILRDVGLLHFPSQLLLPCTLRLLDLSGNNIGERGAYRLAKSLSLTNIERLALRSSRLIGTAPFLELLTTLAIDCKQLSWLDLAHNSLGATGIAAVAWLVRTSTNLLHLDITDNKAPLAALVHAVADHISLKHVTVSNNFILEEDSATTARALARSPGLVLRIASMKYQSSIMQTSVSPLDLAMAIPPKRLDLLDISDNILPTEGFSFDAHTLIADQTPGVSLPSLLQNPNLSRLSFRKCSPVTSATQAIFSSSSIVENTPWTESLHDFSTKLTVLTIADSRLGAHLLAQLIRALPASLRVFDMTNCASGDGGLDALCTYLRSPSGSLERLACDGQRPRVSVVGIRNLVDGIRVCESLLDLKAPLQDAMRAARAEPQFAPEIAKLIKRARHQILENNIKLNNTDAVKVWTAVCDADEELPHDVLPSTNDDTWDVLEFSHIDIASGSFLKNTKESKKPPPPPPKKDTEVPVDDDEEARDSLPSRPAPLAPWGHDEKDDKTTNHVGTPTRPPPPPPRRPGFLEAIQGRSVTNLRATPTHKAQSSPSQHTNGTSSALNSAIDQVLGRRKHIRNNSSTTTDDEADDDDEDW